MAARDLDASKAIRAALGDPAPRGALTALAKSLGVSAATVSRWYTLDSSPDPNIWPAIESALGLPAGALRSTETATQVSPEVLEELLRRVDVLQAELLRLSKVVAKQDAQLKQLRTPARQAAG